MEMAIFNAYLCRCNLYTIYSLLSYSITTAFMWSCFGMYSTRIGQVPLLGCRTMGHLFFVGVLRVEEQGKARQAGQGLLAALCSPPWMLYMAVTSACPVVANNPLLYYMRI